ncbi:NUDIX domain-containing protein [Streptomyces tricolor]|nr:NUDIX domain-containing protein [Streptomyces tricolor]
MTDEAYGALRASAALWAGTSVLITNQRGQILLQRVSYRPTCLLPGGAVDTGESPAQGAARELEEELGVRGERHPRAGGRLGLPRRPHDTPRHEISRGASARLRRRRLGRGPDRVDPAGPGRDRGHRVRRTRRPARSDVSLGTPGVPFALCGPGPTAPAPCCWRTASRSCPPCSTA